MHTLISMINKLNESIAQIENDKTTLTDINTILRDINNVLNIGKDQKTNEIVIDKETSKTIFKNLQRISLSIRHLSVRRGSLMTRTSKKVPWKVLMNMDDAISKLGNESDTLNDFLKDFIKTNEIGNLIKEFGNFQKDR
ncbi:MAG: hypothetical protein LEGION0398_MBIBDBAK_01407 [Legionellaceae bacterium]